MRYKEFYLSEDVEKSFVTKSGTSTSDLSKAEKVILDVSKEPYAGPWAKKARTLANYLNEMKPLDDKLKDLKKKAEEEKDYFREKINEVASSKERLKGNIIRIGKVLVEVSQKTEERKFNKKLLDKLLEDEFSNQIEILQKIQSVVEKAYEASSRASTVKATVEDSYIYEGLLDNLKVFFISSLNKLKGLFQKSNENLKRLEGLVK